MIESAMKSKPRKSYICFIVACVMVMVGVMVLAGYRMWKLFTTDWKEVFQQMRLVDYGITLMIIVMIIAFRQIAKSKA
jgi:TRAP-type C4-dicarboxylate transport system permease small subunit